MLFQGFKKSLFGATAIAGVAAVLTAAAPAYAQSGATGVPTRPSDPPQPDPAVVQPNSDDQAEVRPEVTAPTAEEEAAVEGVVVTGSRIRRDPTTAPTPLVQVTREELLQTGQPNIVDYLADLPQLAGSQVPEDTTGTSLGTGGLSLLNLRFLGTARTLTLVDGRRHVGAAYSASSAVDVDTIPRLLIENTEIVTGASSSVYGADAVSGVVNFILRKNFEGVEIDAGLNQLNEDDDAFSRRISALVGKNFFNNRLNIYAHGEYDEADPVRNANIDFLARDCALIQTDLDPNAATPDGVIDAEVVCGLQNVAFPFGGSLTLANNFQPSPASDPDLPNLNQNTVCATPAANVNLNTQCFNVNPGVSFGFNGIGGPRFPLDFGSFRQPASTTGARNLVIGSTTARSPLAIGNLDRTPRSEARRFQTGFNFDITEWAQLFGEYKYVEELTTFESSSAGFNIGIRAQPATRPTELTGTGTSNFNIGLDNAFLDAATRTLIQNNTRQLFNAAGQPTTTVADPRALYRNSLQALREQENTRTTNRYVVGVRGDFDAIGFLQDVSYELGYTYGEVEDNNVETTTLDSERFAFAADAVVDTAGVVNGQPGQIVCRVQLLAKQGIAIPRYADIANQAVPVSQRRNYSPTDEAITGCRPLNIFGAEALPADVQQYVYTFQERGFQISQEDVLGFVSANLGDFWGAGDIGVAGGFEYRADTFANDIGGPADRFDRVLFGNVYQATPEQGTSVTEFFGEIRVPLLKDLPFIQSLEATASYRTSDYERTGKADTYSFQAFWRINRDVALRATHGKAIRAPALNQLFRSPAQTFVAISDNCSADVINNTVDPTTKANRIKNCAAAGVPTTFQDPVDGSDPGFNASNADLTPEKALTTTYSILLTPRFIPNFSLVLDVYDIQLNEAIETLDVNTLVDLCYDEEELNQFACDLFTRSATTFEIISFNQGPVNFAKIRNRGIDFNGRWRVDLEDVFTRDLGSLTFSLRGNYLLRDQTFADPFNPAFATDFDGNAGEPRVRFKLGTTYARERLGITYEWDFISDTEITDSIALINDPDIRNPYSFRTGSYNEHAVSFRYDLTDQIRVRGGITNLFDAEPSFGVIGNAIDDTYDLFGRRFFLGINYRM